MEQTPPTGAQHEQVSASHSGLGRSFAAMLPLSNSMRQNYAAGVDKYYADHAGHTYRNPHMPGILKTLSTFLTILADEMPELAEATWNVLDMAAGSGEASEAILKWHKQRRAQSKKCPANIHIVATDPYTGSAYADRMGSDTCLPLSFADIANGGLPDTPTRYDFVVCSFALHLVEDSSQKWALLSELATRAQYLVVIAPHKKPTIKDEWGWTRRDPWSPLTEIADASDHKETGGKRGDGMEIYLERVRLRLHASTSWCQLDDDDESQPGSSGK